MDPCSSRVNCFVREETDARIALGGASKSLDIEEKTTKDVAKWPVRLEENLENLVWESQGRTCFQEKELQQITLIE